VSQQLPKHPVNIPDQRRIMCETTIEFYRIDARQLKRRSAKPCGSGTYNSIIRDSTYADQYIVRKNLSTWHNCVIPNEGILSKARWSQRYRATVHAGPT